MYFSDIQISNYKSYRNSSRLVLQTGINIIVGRNNTGKTALLDGLSLQFEANPHRSIETMPFSSVIPKRESSVTFTVTLSKAELMDLLISLPTDGPLSLPLPITDSDISNELGFRHQTTETAETFGKWFFSHDQYTFRLTREAYGTPERAHWLTSDESYIYPHFQRSYENDSLHYCTFKIDRIERTFSTFGYSSVRGTRYSNDFVSAIGPFLNRYLYRFRAERIPSAPCPLGTARTLTADASNLAEVLNMLQENHTQLEQYNSLVREVLPDIYQVNTRRMDEYNRGEVVVWNNVNTLSRNDLAFNLNESGSGVGQVLAMLYVVSTAAEPQVIIIDEPQGFLHPGAVRKLVEVLRHYTKDKHQLIIATHSPTVITSADPSSVTMIKQDGAESTFESIDTKETAEQRKYLVAVGARLSDVFGYDKVLWVEGVTEEICFPLILRVLTGEQLMGTAILGVQNTGDFNRKDTKSVIEIYERLSQLEGGLVPPVVGFIFDKETRSERQIEDLKRQSRGRIHFISKRMFENYLLNPSGITATLNSHNLPEITESQVASWLEQNKTNAKYYKDTKSISDDLWTTNVNGALLLFDLFKSLSAGNVHFEKTTHSPMLTKWLLDNSAQELREVSDLITSVLSNS